jgi:hypothetical protein
VLVVVFHFGTVIVVFGPGTVFVVVEIDVVVWALQVLGLGDGGGFPPYSSNVEVAGVRFMASTVSFEAATAVAIANRGHIIVRIMETRECYAGEVGAKRWKLGDLLDGHVIVNTLGWIAWHEGTYSSIQVGRGHKKTGNPAPGRTRDGNTEMVRQLCRRGIDGDGREEAFWYSPHTQNDGLGNRT